MKHFFARLLTLTLVVCCAISAVHSNTPTPAGVVVVTCPLPPPENLNADIVTPTTITLSWTPASGTFPAEYKITFFDETTQVPLADAYTTLTTHTRTGLTPGHTYLIGVSASDCVGGPYGREANITVRTSIIILDDIVQNCPLNQGQSMSNGQNYPVTLTPPASPNEEVQFKRFKVYTANGSAEFSLYAGCDLSPRYSEASLQNVYRDPQGDNLETEYIQFYFTGGTQFFRLHHAGYGVSANSLSEVYITFNTAATMQQCSVTDTCSSCCVMSGSGRAAHEDADPVIIHSATFTQGTVPSDGESVQSAGPSQTGILPALTVSPNPAHTEFTAIYALKSESKVTRTLSDVTGRAVKVIEPPFLLPAGPQRANFQIGDLPPGVYFLTLRTSEGLRTATVVKQ